ncbi:MAG: thioredoxin [Clostridia bacterium]|nr:thioredoxin [Clostridia bacterium]
MSVKIFNDNNFNNEVLNEKGKILVDFYADWCGPCKMMSPIIDEIAEEIENITVGKVNVDENPEIASKYGIMSIPTIIIFENGMPQKKFIGLTSKSEIESELK